MNNSLNSNNHMLNSLSQKIQLLLMTWPTSKRSKKNAMQLGKLKDLEKTILQNFSQINFLIFSSHLLPLRKLLRTMPPQKAREIKFSQISLDSNKIQLMLLKMNFCSIFLCVSLLRKTERDTNKSNLKDFWTLLKPIIFHLNL